MNAALAQLLWRARFQLPRVGDRRVVASVSGGADSACASLLLKELGIKHDRVFMDTVWEKKEHYEYLRGPLTEALGPIIEIRSDLGFVDLVKKKGLFPSRVMRFCTVELKVKPIQSYLNELALENEIVNVVGIRRAESKARSEMTEWEWSDGFDCEVWRPLVRWSKEDVAAMLVRHGLDPNPLYAMGATRVGCWPCIHARKSELAMIARVDPGRIDEIEAVELELNTLGAERDAQLGRPFVTRSMFSYHGGDDKHIAMPIRQAVEWANSKRGEWQPPGAGDGCARHGLCATDDDVPGDIPARHLRTNPPLQMTVEEHDDLSRAARRLIEDMKGTCPKLYACGECGWEQDSMVRPCGSCSSLRVVPISFLEQHFGANWRLNFPHKRNLP